MRRQRLEFLVAVGAVVLALAPLLVVVITRVGTDWLPIHDVAITDMRVRDVWSSDTPLVGPYSRYLWNHPGPLLFWMLAVPSALSGQAAWGVLIGGALVQAIAVVWAGVLGWKTGRLPAVLVTMLVIALTYRAIGPLVVLEPWNPHIALPWFVLFVLYAWRLALGEVHRLPAAFFVATFLVQTHIGYLPLVVAGVAVVVAYRLVDRRHGPTELVGGRPLLITAAIGVVLWAPVVVEQFVHEPGNLTRLSDYFLGGQHTEPMAGWRASLGLLGAEFKVPPPWLGGQERHDLLTAVQPGRPVMIIVPILLLLLGYVGARLAGEREHRRLVTLVAALFGAGVVALSRVTGDLLEYLYYWRVPLALGVIACGLIGTADLLTRRLVTTDAMARAAAIASVVILAGASVGITIAVATHGPAVKEDETDVRAILDQIDTDELRSRSVLVRFQGSTLGGLQGGLVDALDRTGLQVKVDDELAFQFGEHRAATPSEVDEIWYALEEGVLTSIRTSDPKARVVARLMPLGPEAEAELVELQLQLRAQLRSADRLDLQPVLDSDLVALALQDVPGVDHDAAARLAVLNADVLASDRCRCSIVAYDPVRS